MKRRWILAVLCLVIILMAAPLWAADEQAELAKKAQISEEEEKAELAKKAQNPVADLISIPIQSNFNFNYGANRDKSQIVNNIQPAGPVGPGLDI